MAETLCATGDVSVFKKCPYVHGMGLVQNRKTEDFTLISKKGERTKMKRVTYCPGYKKQTPRKADGKSNIWFKCQVCGRMFLKTTGRKTCSTGCANTLMSINRKKGVNRIVQLEKECRG